MDSKTALNYLATVLAAELQRFAHLRVNTLIPELVHSPQGVKTHTGESPSEHRELATTMPDFVYWSIRESRGRSGEVVVVST